MGVKIIQIIPATGVVAEFTNGSMYDVLAWGLTDEGEVVPMVIANEFLEVATEYTNFKQLHGGRPPQTNIRNYK